MYLPSNTKICHPVECMRKSVGACKVVLGQSVDFDLSVSVDTLDSAKRHQ